MKNFLTESNNKAPIADFHAIVTDHPRMKALGLGVFTTGDLNAWLHQLKKGFDPGVGVVPPKEFYTNWSALNYADMDTILGQSYSDDPGWGSFKGWRRHGSTGKYEDQQLGAWSWSAIGDDISFSQDDLLIDSYWDFSQTGSVFENIKPDGEDFDISDGWFTKFVRPSKLGRNFFDGATSDILSVINMNKFINQFGRYYPRDEWVNTPDATLTSAKLQAMEAFLNDVKASKWGCINFSGIIPFNINQADGGIQCLLPEYVNFKLYLYDDSKVRETENTAVLRDSIKFAGVKRDSLGRAYKTKVDGEFVDVTASDPSDQSIGELDRRWNPYTKKWESGSTNIFGKVVNFIGSAVNNPSVESLIDSDIKADLDGDEDRHFAPSSGLVMPVEMQNSNPMQWQPNYASPSGCTERTKEKAMVVGFNYNPLKSYPRDTLVMLTQIAGIWHITDMGSGISKKDQPVDATFEGKWDFQYMATNSNHFFTAIEDKEPLSKMTRVDPEVVERSVHRDYYADDPFNGGRDIESDFNEYYEDIEGVSTLAWTKKGANSFHSQNGWWQFTSFDFMDNLIGGTHEKNFIASTNPLVDSAGRSIGVGTNSVGQAAHTHGFFGCIFPDGYTLNTTSAFFGDRDFVVFPASNRKLNTAYPTDTELFFDTSVLSDDITADPFIDPTNSYDKSEQSSPVTFFGGDNPYDPARSQPRSAVGGIQKPIAGGGGTVVTYSPEAEAVDSDGNPSKYNSFVYAFAPSMFYQETHQNARDLKQLPADIATLSSPAGKNGCPIQDIHAYIPLMSDLEGQAHQRACEKVFHRRHWLRRSLPLNPPIPEDEQIYDENDSAFGFQPKQKNKVMFRPLKFGTYAQFLAYDLGGAGNYAIENEAGERLSGPWSASMLTGASRGSWSAEIARMMMPRDADGLGTTYYGTFASPTCVTRNLAGLNSESQFDNRSSSRLIQARHTLWDDVKGLLMRGDISPEGVGGPGNHAAGDRAFHFPSYGGRVHDQNFMRYESFNGVPGNIANRGNIPRSELTNDGLIRDNRGANAFGVIGAIATTFANSQITFTTNQAFGMLCESRRTVGTSFLKPAWGGSDVNRPDSNRTTALFATVYHAWPREQTIYDARYFAVHHFNPNILDKDSPVLPGVYDDPIIRVPVSFQRRDGDDIVEFTNNIMTRSIVLDEDGLPDLDTNNRPKIDKPNRKLPYEVPVPTYFGNDGQNAVSCGVGATIFKNAVFDGGVNRGSLLAESQWNFESDRLGKLLPYRYSRLLVAVPFASGVDIETGGNLITLTGDIDEDGVTAESLAGRMVIRGSGEGYQRGDIVGNTTSKIRFSVEEVGERNVPDGAGNTRLARGVITKLKPYSMGNISSSSLPNAEATIKPNMSAGISIKNIAANGNGFNAFIVNGMTVRDYPIDHKPKVVDTNGRYMQLTLNADSGTGESATNTRQDPILDLSGLAGMFGIFGGGGGGVTTNRVGGDYGLVIGEKSTAILIPPEKRAENKKYDIFLHFHNDISHTWADTGYGDVFNPYDILDQFVELQINAI